MKKSQNKIARFFTQIVTLEDTPHRIAAGAAVGLFVGILPIESILAVLLITAMFKLNYAAALISVAVTNVWAMIIVLPLAAIVGGNLFGTSSEELANQFSLAYQGGLGYFFTKDSLLSLALPLFTGYLVISALVSLVLYCLIYALLRSKRHPFITS